MYTVLFAEDTDIVRELFCGVLRRSGYCVLEAEDGVEALSLARRHPGPIHLLITDIMMPRLGGLELRHALRTSHPEAAVLFISGYAGEEAHCDAPFLQKPFTSVRLLARVTDILQASVAPRAFASPDSSF
jgi:two-component system, cell cycle sensor histidine kinase and response regulator CckA